MSFIEVRHNIEVAHRLFNLNGKCEQIHGHSMWVDLRLHGPLDSSGILAGLDFSVVKKAFRGYLDEKFDHHLLLNEDDPYARKIAWVEDRVGDMVEEPMHLPGLKTVPGDPTTENLAKWIAKWATATFSLPADVVVRETAVNAAGYSARPNGGDNG